MRGEMIRRIEMSLPRSHLQTYIAFKTLHIISATKHEIIPHYTDSFYYLTWVYAHLLSVLKVGELAVRQILLLIPKVPQGFQRATGTRVTRGSP